MFDTEKFISEIEARPSLYDVKCASYSNREEKARCWFEVGYAMFNDWDELEEAEKEDRVKELMKKWKAVRDAFVRDHKLLTATGTGNATRSKKKYVYYDQLLFLLPSIKGNSNTSSNNDPTTTQSNDDTCNQSTPDIGELEEEPAGKNDPNLLNTPTKSNDTAQINEREVKKSKKSNKKKRFEGQRVLVGKRSALESSEASCARDLTILMAQTLKMQQEDRNSDQFGHKSFLSSFVPVLNSMPLHTAMQLRGQISDIFSQHFRQYDQPSTCSPPLTPKDNN